MLTILPTWLTSESVTWALPPLLENIGMNPLWQAVPEEQTTSFFCSAPCNVVAPQAANTERETQSPYAWVGTFHFHTSSSFCPSFREVSNLNYGERQAAEHPACEMSARRPPVDSSHDHSESMGKTADDLENTSGDAWLDGCRMVKWT
jgi:hypothetical protein